MRLEIASKKAIKYACKNFHYSKSIPQNIISFSVFNSKDEWCGVIMYGMGGNTNLGLKYGLVQGELLELVRVALNGKQENTSKPVSISIKMIRKFLPTIKLLISYADMEQEHYGTIYQATNWIFESTHNTGDTFYHTKLKKRIHQRHISDKYSIDLVHSGIIKRIKQKPKHKYLFPLTDDLKIVCKKLSKPYPKKLAEIV